MWAYDMLEANNKDIRRVISYGATVPGVGAADVTLIERMDGTTEEFINGAPEEALKVMEEANLENTAKIIKTRMLTWCEFYNPEYVLKPDI